MVARATSASVQRMFPRYGCADATIALTDITAAIRASGRTADAAFSTGDDEKGAGVDYEIRSGSGILQMDRLSRWKYRAMKWY